MASIGEKIWWGGISLSLGGLMLSIYKEASKLQFSTMPQPVGMAPQTIGKIPPHAGESLYYLSQPNLITSDLEKIGIGVFSILITLTAAYLWLFRERVNTRVVAKIALSTGPIEIGASAIVSQNGRINRDNVNGILGIARGTSEDTLKIEKQEEHPLHKGVYVPDFVAAETRNLLDKIPHSERQNLLNK